MLKKVLWPLGRIQEGLERFRKEHGRYPTASEFDSYSYLPRAKTIERRFGGLIALRKQLGLGDEHDLRSGAHSSKRAHLINERAHKLERKVYDLLVERFSRQFVHREYFFTDDHRTRADFFVYDTQNGFCVDVFYPNSRSNLIGCLNLKLNKYRYPEELLPYPVIFLQMNDSIDQDVLDDVVTKKKRQLAKGQSLMAWETFRKFCSSRNALKVLGDKNLSARRNGF